MTSVRCDGPCRRILDADAPGVRFPGNCDLVVCAECAGDEPYEIGGGVWDPVAMFGGEA